MPHFVDDSYFPPKRPDDPDFFNPPVDKINPVVLFFPNNGYIDDPQLSVENLQQASELNGATFMFNHQKSGVLSRFYNFLIIRKHIDSSPLPKIIPKRPEPMKPYIYTLKELRSLLAATNKLQSPLISLRACTFSSIRSSGHSVAHEMRRLNKNMRTVFYFLKMPRNSCHP